MQLLISLLVNTKTREKRGTSQFGDDSFARDPSGGAITDKVIEVRELSQTLKKRLSATPADCLRTQALGGYIENVFDADTRMNGYYTEITALVELQCGCRHCRDYSLGGCVCLAGVVIPGSSAGPGYMIPIQSADEHFLSPRFRASRRSPRDRISGGRLPEVRGSDVPRLNSAVTWTPEASHPSVANFAGTEELCSEQLI